MATKKKLLQAAAGNAGGFLNVEEVFSTYLYQGTSANQTITNDIDLSGEGGLVWVKGRPNAGYSHGLYDTERGVTKRLASNETSAESTYANSVTAFNNDGFSLGSDGNGEANFSGSTYVSWTFRKAHKFFDIQTITVTRDGSNNLSSTSPNVSIVSGEVFVNHELGSVPAISFQKSTSAASSAWYVRTTVVNGYLQLHRTSAAAGSQVFSSTDTQIELGNFGWFASGTHDYVIYLFAHNDGDGEFVDGNQDIIKCGSYTGNGSGTGPTVNLGFEPQWLLIKNASASSNWTLFDNMRGLGVPTLNTGYKDLNPNLSNAEAEGRALGVTATGFQIVDNHAEINGSGNNYIYIAIRRGTAVPTSATDVFDVGDASETGSSAPEYEGGFVVDMAIKRIMSSSQPNYVFDRLRGGQSLRTDTTAAESAFGAAKFDYMDGYYNGTSNSSTNWSAMWKRAPNYFDVVAYTGTGSVRTVSHNLGVVPEMMWVKRRDGARRWPVYHSALGPTKFLLLDNTNAENTNSNIWNDTAPTDTVFTTKQGQDANANNTPYIAYLFASLDGISKVSSVTHSGTTNVDCGFSSGAKFVLLKRTDSAGNWFVFDSNRGIVAGSNDPYFLLNTNGAPTTGDDYIDPLPSGFTITSSLTSGDYIFYAIA